MEDYVKGDDMNFDLSLLQQITQDIYRRLLDLSRQDGRQLVEMLSMQEYHGFGKARLPESFVAEVLHPYGVRTVDVQAEVIRVSTDLSKEIHFHKESTACVIILGREVYLDDPKSALAYVRDHWAEVCAQEEILIPRGTAHGFTVDVEQGGILYFLSVQAPPIVRDDGHDDYYHT